jgi:GntR family transcriptional regulator
MKQMEGALLNQLAGRLRLDFRSSDPIFLQIARQIETQVKDGTLKPGDQLPTVRELAIDLRINFSTVARAYRILDEQRLISTQRGRGTYISDDEPGEIVQGPKDDQLARDKLSGLTRKFIRESLESGASLEQIEKDFRQQLENWNRNIPTQSGLKFGG